MSRQSCIILFQKARNLSKLNVHSTAETPDAARGSLAREPSPAGKASSLGPVPAPLPALLLAPAPEPAPSSSCSSTAGALAASGARLRALSAWNWACSSRSTRTCPFSTFFRWDRRTSRNVELNVVFNSFLFARHQHKRLRRSAPRSAGACAAASPPSATSCFSVTESLVSAALRMASVEWCTKSASTTWSNLLPRLASRVDPGLMLTSPVRFDSSALVVLSRRSRAVTKSWPCNSIWIDGIDCCTWARQSNLCNTSATRRFRRARRPTAMPQRNCFRCTDLKWPLNDATTDSVARKSAWIGSPCFASESKSWSR
mmetsp:Transcript_96613/g.301461  ORF Transcript_96613/g.301461 Transcript_96613/m.301461 type:complete len:315 (-) Transcript_96613:588-1532(-)